MANLTPTSSFDNVYQFEVTDIIQGGPGGIDNQPHQQLLNRTEWLNNNKVSNAGDTINGLLTIIRAAATALAIRSNAAGSFAQKTIGRTSDETYYGVAGAANDFFTGSVAGDSVIRAVGRLLLGGGGGTGISQAAVLTTSGVGLFGAPTYALDIAQRAATPNVIAVRSPAGQYSMLSLAGNNTNPLSSSFDIYQDSASGATINNRSGAINIYSSNALAATVDTSQRFSFAAPHSIFAGGTTLGGLIGSSSFTDSFLYDTNKVVHNYGLNWIQYSFSSGGPSAALSGYGGISLFSGGNFTAWAAPTGFWVFGNNTTQRGSAMMTFDAAPQNRPVAFFNGASGYGYIALAMNGTPFGYVGQSNALIAGGVAANMCLRGENAIDFTLGPVRYGTFSSSGLQVTSAGAASTTTGQFLSGAAGSYAGVGVGRTGSEVTLGVCANANDYFGGTVAGDGILDTGAGNLFVGTFPAKNLYLLTNNTNRFQVDSTGALYVRPDLAGSAIDLSALTSRSLSGTGYQKLPGGLILQWGNIATSNTTITFPIAFPNACFRVFPTNSDGQGSNNDNAYVTSITTTGCFLATKSAAGATSNFGIAWFAIGN